MGLNSWIYLILEEFSALCDETEIGRTEIDQEEPVSPLEHSRHNVREPSEHSIITSHHPQPLVI